MRIGAHVRDDDPLGAARERGADVVQFFLSDPQGWRAPKPHPQAEALRESGLTVFVHAPYVINVASLNNRIRIPSRKSLAQQADAAAAIGAAGLIVHGGHVTKGEDPAEGLANWRKLFERQQDAGGFPLPVLIENTAGGDNAMARRFDMLARLWDQVGEFGAGFCLDTCHAHAAGEDLLDVVARVRAITGRIDLVHLNDSRDEFGSSRDRHANIGAGQIDPQLLVAVVAEAQAPVVVETPAEGQAEDITFLREQLAG
ncbi:deoxyribonuclease IV [Goodfellowiella coeruleoviolacea]|uniref:Endonuclease IV n=1 Tax=Goodfellowiella coeruleoviolacea TaxID=334858 RepID=A0AAE3GK88_9PSEU|nr:deoxyribonuclease IV [Goodfellowiella coeruleoviolacea]MCP2168899.1 Endonuclease IV [Goodfellowiella coeruleoviolacea]